MEQLPFSGVRWVPIDTLGISQIYLSQQKLQLIAQWFSPAHPEAFAPLPVHDFGNGRLTLTDGHSRAFSAWAAGWKEIPVVYDMDEIITNPLGQLLYKNDIIWCDRFHLRSPADLANRILSREDYQLLWNQRCDLAYNLLTKTTAEGRLQLSSIRADLFLFGASEDLQTLYFEDGEGAIYHENNLL